MSVRPQRRSRLESPIWNCRPCMAQFFGAARCQQHNPTPEEREAKPQWYPRFMHPSASDFAPADDDQEAA